MSTTAEKAARAIEYEAGPHHTILGEGGDVVVDARHGARIEATWFDDNTVDDGEEVRILVGVKGHAPIDPDELLEVLPSIAASVTKYAGTWDPEHLIADTIGRVQGWVEAAMTR